MLISSLPHANFTSYFQVIAHCYPSTSNNPFYIHLQVEQAVLSSGANKKLVLVLNKIGKFCCTFCAK